MEHLKLYEIIFQYGVPTALLVFVFWRFIIPIFDAFLENIKIQTKVLGEILKNNVEQTEQLNRIENGIKKLNRKEQ